MYDPCTHGDPFPFDHSPVRHLAQELRRHGVITAAALPLALLSFDKPGALLAPVLQDLGQEAVARAFSLPLPDLLQELRAYRDLPHALAAVVELALAAGKIAPEALLVRYYCPRPRGGFQTGLVLADSLQLAMAAMLERQRALLQEAGVGI